MYSEKITPKVERLFDDLRAKIDAILENSGFSSSAVDEIVKAVSVETSSRSKSILSDMLFDLSDQLFETPFFADDVSRRNRFTELNVRQEIVDTIRSLPMLEQMGGVSRSDIVDAELQLRTSFSAEYKDYLLTFGAISAKGIELTGIIKAEYLNVVAVTKQEWELNVNVPHNMYVVENTYIDGIIIWQSTSGEIFKTTPGSAPKMIAPSLNVYIQEHMR